MSSNNDGERTVADRYVLRRELGRGGMGIVWEAYDPELHRDVAIKQVLLPGHFTPEERDDAHARVRREARSAARVSHPTVITIHDVFEHDGSPWVVMELVEGGSLRDMLNEQGALEVSLVAKIGESLLQAVHYANQAGVLHRDIKPGNIMMSSDGRVILTDFGIATIEGGPSITRTGALIGSPEYMAPERLEGAEAEHRNDLWSIGVTLFAAVEGHSPFGRDNITSAIAAVISGPIPQMERAGWLEPVITGLLERDPDRRLTVERAMDLLRGRGGNSDTTGSTEAAGAAGMTGTAGAAGALGAVSANTGGHPAAPHGGTEYDHAAQGPPTPHAQYGPYGQYGQYGHHHDPYTQDPYATHAVHGGGHPDMGGRRGPSMKTVFGIGAGALAVLLLAGVAVAVLRTSSQDEGQVADPPVGERPDSDPVPDGADAPGDGQEQVDEGGDPPDYDDLTTFRAEPFTIDHPQGWTVDDSEIDQSTAIFYPSGYDQQIWVTGWPEDIDAGSSHDFLAETEGGTADDPATTGFTELELEDFDDDFDAGWDVALMEADFVNDTWPTPERRYWVYAIAIESQGQQMMYNVSVNVPRDQEDFYDDLHEDVVETFTPHL